MTSMTIAKEAHMQNVFVNLKDITPEHIYLVQWLAQSNTLCIVTLKHSLREDSSISENPSKPQIVKIKKNKC